MCYIHGIKIKKNEELGKEFIINAANQSNLFAIGYCYYRQWGDHKKNFEEAFEYFTRAYKINNGDIWAMYYIGKCYFEGKGKSRDYKKAMEWLNKAANHKCPLAMNMIGEFYDSGIGEEMNVHKAFEWYKKAAEENYSTSLYNVGSCYEFGTGVEKDLKMAHQYYIWAKDPEDEIDSSNCYPFGESAQTIEWFQQLAHSGDVNAQLNIGMCYIHGINVHKDMEIGKDLISIAANQGNSFALGYCYYTELGQYKKDYDYAFYYFMKSFRTERNVWAMYYIGLCYLEGNGKTKDEKKAIEWFNKAADEKCPLAVYEIGKCYENGIGVKKNLEDAFHRYLDAASQNYSKALYNVAKCYHSGKGAVQDLYQAEQFYERAKNLGIELETPFLSDAL
jgi:TPR repeat protein